MGINHAPPLVILSRPWPKHPASFPTYPNLVTQVPSKRRGHQWPSQERQASKGSQCSAPQWPHRWCELCSHRSRSPAMASPGTAYLCIPGTGLGARGSQGSSPCVQQHPSPELGAGGVLAGGSALLGTVARPWPQTQCTMRLLSSTVCPRGGGDGHRAQNGLG